MKRVKRRPPRRRGSSRKGRGDPAPQTRKVLLPAPPRPPIPIMTAVPIGQPNAVPIVIAPGRGRGRGKIALPAIRPVIILYSGKGRYAPLEPVSDIKRALLGIRRR